MRHKNKRIIFVFVTCIVVGLSMGLFSTKLAKVSANVAELYPLNSCTKQPKQSPNDINVVTYNIGGRSNCGDGCAAGRIRDIKKLITELNYADIIGLQEVPIIKRKTNSTPAHVEEEFRQFQSQFAGYTIIYRGHQDIQGKPPPGMEGKPPGGMNSGQWYGNMIITKFPMREGSYREFLLMKNRDVPRYFFQSL